jgi:hypothetical protein
MSKLEGITPVPDLDNEAWSDLLYREAIGEATANESKFIQAAYDSMTPAQLKTLEAQEAAIMAEPSDQEDSDENS